MLCTDNLYSSLPLLEELDRRDIKFVGTLRSNRKGVVREMLNTQGRAENSVIVWREAEEGRWSITSYLRKTKSKGWKVILLLSNETYLPFMGVTKDDGQNKTALNKTYDYLKTGTDVAGNRNKYCY